MIYTGRYNTVLSAVGCDDGWPATVPSVVTSLRYSLSEKPTQPALEQLRRRKWKWIRQKLRRSDNGIAKRATVDATRPQRKRTTEKHLEKRSGEENVDSGLEVRLEEDGYDTIRQSWVETWSLWPMVNWE